MLQFLPLLAPIVSQLVGLIPDPEARAKAEAEATGQLVSVLTAQNTAQAEVNKIEAASASVFVAGWRPFIGWVCGMGLAWQYIGLPIAAAVITNINPAIVLPSLGSDNLMELVFAMLGLGGLRTFEKIKGAARK